MSCFVDRFVVLLGHLPLSFRVIDLILLSFNLSSFPFGFLLFPFDEPDDASAASDEHDHSAEAREWEDACAASDDNDDDYDDGEDNCQEEPLDLVAAAKEEEAGKVEERCALTLAHLGW